MYFKTIQLWRGYIAISTSKPFRHDKHEHTAISRHAPVCHHIATLSTNTHTNNGYGGVGLRTPRRQRPFGNNGYLPSPSNSHGRHQRRRPQSAPLRRRGRNCGSVLLAVTVRAIRGVRHGALIGSISPSPARRRPSGGDAGAAIDPRSVQERHDRRSVRQVETWRRMSRRRSGQEGGRSSGQGTEGVGQRRRKEFWSGRREE